VISRLILLYAMSKYKIDILTGLRPTANLTIANYIGGVAPIIELSSSDKKLMLFIADLHALTTHEPGEIKRNIKELLLDYIALGVDFRKVDIFLQSDIEGEVSVLTLLLSSQVTVAELLRVPTLKEKIKENRSTETANALLFLYPVLMAADILIQRTNKVPLGKDQLPHMEMTRLLARRFNKKYGEVFPIPSALQTESVNILGLKGHNKMSKSIPSNAIFLTDETKTVEKKIKSAETAKEGEMSKHLESHILIAKKLAKSDKEKEEIDEIIKDHLDGKAVMGKFKEKFLEIILKFLADFQTKRKAIGEDEKLIEKILKQGKEKAKANAQETLLLVKKAMHG